MYVYGIRLPLFQERGNSRFSLFVCSSIGKRPSITFRLTKMLKELPIKYFVSKMRRTEQFLLTYQQVIIPRVQVSYV